MEMGPHTITIEEEERQAILLALAHLALERPGWNDSLSDLALKMDNRMSDGRPQLFESFKRFATPNHHLKSNSLHQAATAAVHALRSYQCGNSARDLAKEVADKLEAAIPRTY